MKNIIIGLVLGIVLAVGGVATAKVITTPDVLSIVEQEDFGFRVGHVFKMYDSANGAVCYIEAGGPSNTISCIK